MVYSASPSGPALLWIGSPSGPLLSGDPTRGRAASQPITRLFAATWSVTANYSFGVNGKKTMDMCLGLTDEELTQREVDFIDIATDEIPDKQYQASEDCTKFKSKKTNRGPLAEGWRDSHDPIMCSYKLVTVKFEVWGLQTRVEAFAHRAIRDILLVGHRQAFAWVDEWYGMGMEDVRDFEQRLQEETNQREILRGLRDPDRRPQHQQTARPAIARHSPTCV
ncbi:hypothetical protein Bbelb_211020 [Branchiostoma belcheri]|nr:hypothetical protein Bbelb_211020 [Branchiostoma belcheri]